MQQKLTDFLIPAYEQTNTRVTVQSFVEEQQLYTNWFSVEYEGWKLPATAEPHYWCGEWQRRGCLNAENHRKLGFGNNIFVRQYRRSCYRPTCKVCYHQWIIRQSNRATRRIEKYAKMFGREPFHLMLSVPLADYSSSYNELKKKLNCIIKDLGVYGSAVVFHPFRLRRPNRKQHYYSPHFHLVCFGEISGRVSYIGKKYGWYVKYLKTRDSVFKTFCYLLSHSGIKKGYRSMTWIGSLSYGKLKLEKEPDLNICPCCRVKLVEIYRDVFDPVIPPGKYYEGFVDPGGWYEVKPMVFDSNYRYDYAPIMHLNEILRGISIAS